MDQQRPSEHATGVQPPPAQRRPAVAAITVLYDAYCPVCRTARAWVERQHQLVPVTFVAAGSEAARQHFPELNAGATLENITVIDDTGGVYRGDNAWMVVLWCLRPTRRLALDIAHNRRRSLFHSVVNATEWVRRVSRSEGPVVAVNPAPPPRFPGGYYAPGPAPQMQYSAGRYPHYAGAQYPGVQYPGAQYPGVRYPGAQVPAQPNTNRPVLSAPSPSPTVPGNECNRCDG